MRVLIATQHLGIVGGVETYLRAVLPRLVAAGFDVGVLAESAGGCNAGILADCPGVPVWLAGGRPIGETVADVAGWGPGVVYSHGLSDPRLEAELVGRFPTILFAHNYHGTCVSGTKRYGLPVARPCGRRFGPGCLARYFPRRCGGLDPLTALRLYRVQGRRAGLLPRYRAVLTASGYMADEFRRAGVPAGQVLVVPLFPTDCEPDPEPPRPRAPSGRVLMVGRLTRVKGGDHLIEALPRAADRLGRALTLVVAGDGSDLPRLRALAGRRGVPAEFHGWMSDAGREALTRGADLLAVPSVWPEPFGLVGIEAGCAGVPAAGYAVGGIPDWLIPGVSGESAPGDWPDPRALAEAIVRALADDAHWNRLRRGAWEMARRFSPTAHLAALSRALSHAAT
jgi:glycosyltransferase involved in cell wall biosynthesis